MNIDSYALIWVSIGITTYVIGAIEQSIRGNIVFPKPFIDEIYIIIVVTLLGGMSAYNYIKSWFEDGEGDWYE